MAHLPWEELAKRQREAEGAAPLGARYEHYKTGDVYRVVRHGIDEATDLAGVLYESERHPEVTFWRPMGNLLADVIVEGEEQPRFRRID